MARRETTKIPMDDRKKTASDDYTSDQIQHLEGIEGIRLRPAMYIGGTDTVGLHHLVFETTDNVLDEYVNGFATTLNVVINGDESVTIFDDGRGIPVGMMKVYLSGAPSLESST